MSSHSPMTEFELASVPRLVEELSITPRQITAVARLLNEGNTIPFIARYRKEVHGDLDEVQLLKIQERLTYYREFEERRATILKLIAEQEKLTPQLEAKIKQCQTKAELEDIYLPFKPKRRTRAMIAREKGLQALADAISRQSLTETPQTLAATFVDEEKGVEDVEMALAGARDIVAEEISENADIRGLVRKKFTAEGIIVSSALKKETEQITKFEQYYDFQEALNKIPSHRFLAIKRGQTEGVLKVKLECAHEVLIAQMAEKSGLNPASPYAEQLQLALEDSYKRLIAPSVEVDVMVEKKMEADQAAVEIFANNLRHLLLQSPLGEKPIIGIDPGLRSGCKCVALDATGKFLETCTIYLVQGGRGDIEAKVLLCKLIAKHRPNAIAIGNGTGGRETEVFVRNVLKEANLTGITVISVNESGASVYSASDIAREEFPDLDLTIRGAISIGRRLQDPLAELVKIDPKSIGVGQYQHDVHQALLARKLDEVVVSCVNHVGVELNTASASLLTRVSGIGSSMANKIVAYRDANGAFLSRQQLTKIPGLGPKTFEQAAGFLRIRGATHPLDNSAVHPEKYGLVEEMARDCGVEIVDLISNNKLVDAINLSRYISEEVGEPTLRDIVDELKKPGRDPRATFEAVAFREDVTAIEDLTEGMVLEGIVTNVTAFGAFVDIGVHQDGLVHVSELSDRFIKEPAEVVKTGDRLKVRVLNVDKERRRIALSAKQESRAPRAPRRSSEQRSGRAPSAPRRSFGGSQFKEKPRDGFINNPFGDL